MWISTVDFTLPSLGINRSDLFTSLVRWHYRPKTNYDDRMNDPTSLSSVIANDKLTDAI